MLKESISFGALAIAITMVLKLVRTKELHRPIFWVILIFSLLLLWKLKYYYAAAAIPILGALLIFETVKVSRKLKFR